MTPRYKRPRKIGALPARTGAFLAPAAGRGNDHVAQTRCRIAGCIAVLSLPRRPLSQAKRDRPSAVRRRGLPKRRRRSGLLHESGATAYDQGYREGVKEGEKDGRQRRPIRVSRTSENSSAPTRAITANYGDRERYRQIFRDGYADGYSDGYLRALVTHVATAERPLGPYAPAGRIRGWGYGRRPLSTGAYYSPAFDNGARDGYEKGQEDARKNRSFDPLRHSWYRSGITTTRDGTARASSTRIVYRQGFQHGYERGYLRRPLSLVTC